MKPYEIFTTVFRKWIKSCGAALGYDILKKNFTFTFHTFNTIVGIVSVAVFSVYTAFAYDFEVALKAMSIINLAWQVSCKSIGYGN